MRKVGLQLNFTVSMPPVEDKSKDGDSEELSISKPLIGIIYPPPEVRSILGLFHYLPDAD